MRTWILAALAMFVATGGGGAADLPDVEAAIPPPVKALGQPGFRPFPEGIRMAVSATNAEAQAHCQQGLNHLHGGWEFEASRHFAAALREDPECLLAHWGMLMCLLNPTPETRDARDATLERMLDLVDRGFGTTLERGYAYGLIKYLDEGPAGGANAFRKIANQFPNDLQAAVLAALFSRGGYDAMGEATPDQLAAEQSLLGLVAKYPKCPLPLNALLVIRADGPDLTESLPLARQLCALVPDYGPYLHMLGHYEWRCGKHPEAAASFQRAANYYRGWLTDQKADVADCPEWLKAECYRIVAVLSQGDFASAYPAARRVAATEVAANRPASPGKRFLLWDAMTLPARILLQHGLRGNVNEAANSLPKPADLLDTHGSSLAYWWLDGLRFALEAQRLIETNDLTGARQAVDALTQHGELMVKSQDTATMNGERLSWNQAFRALEVLASDVRGRLIMAGPKDRRGPAFNWFRSAADRQRPAPLLYPPLLLTPMATHLADYYLSNNQAAEAIETYQTALKAFPNDLPTLHGLKQAYLAADQAADAEAIDRQIGKLQPAK